ncbi:MAG: hypothetical protein K2G14_03215, partial [Ruminococcus sp.]|nr:hypothetical protein [Ruminococcus sp.]
IGDVNQDWIFNKRDVDIIMDFYYNEWNYTDEEVVFFKKYADANNDGGINHEDIILITNMYTDYDADAQMGDVNHDGYVDCIDATMVMVYYAALSTDNYDLYTEEEHANFKMYGNVYEDEYVDVIDAHMISVIYAENAKQAIE